MDWVKNFDLFLFDFDGLLVDTEHIHYMAYINLLKEFGYDLGWSFDQFASIALKGDILKQEIYKKFPKLYNDYPDWSFLYQKKKDIYFDLLQRSKLSLMEGVEKLLLKIKDLNIPSCVVTNSIRPHIDLIVKNISQLSSINYWITREDYKKAKPFPECYQKAIDLYGPEKKRIIAFEDSLKGINAIIPTRAKPVLINANKNLSEQLDSSISYFENFKSIPSDFN